MDQIKIPDGYQSALNLHDTQIAIKTVKDFFQQTLSQKLNLLASFRSGIRKSVIRSERQLKRCRTPGKL